MEVKLGAMDFVIGIMFFGFLVYCLHTINRSIWQAVDRLDTVVELLSELKRN
jgi:hypothetical protein